MIVKREMYYQGGNDNYDKKERRDLEKAPQVKKQTKVGKQRKPKGTKIQRQPKV